MGNQGSSVVVSFKFLLLVIGCSGFLLETAALAQDRESLAGEKAEESLKAAAQAEMEDYNIHWGPVAFRTGVKLGVGYTDNAFYTQEDRKEDYVIMPEVDLAAFMQVSQLNTIKLAVGVGYEYYTKNHDLNSDAPLINPNSELSFNLFVGDFHLRFHESFLYQETLFVNTTASGQDLLFNFNDVGTFKRWDNNAGVDMDWDLDKLIISAGFIHENFESTTESFKYLNRDSEWLTASAALLIGDKARVGVEGQGSLHNYKSEVTLNDNWRARGGPFMDIQALEKINLRAGGGYDTARYDSAGESSDYKTYYAYGQVSQDTRFFRHNLSGGRESTLGDNANNIESDYIRYSISSPIVRYLDLSASGAVHFDREYGGAFTEHYTYWIAGAKVGYQIHKYWRVDLGYEYLIKDSDLPDRDFYRNRVTLGVAFAF